MQDVQFFTEVMDSVQTLDGGRRSMYDPDEIEEEQRERDQRNKVCAGRGWLVLGVAVCTLASDGQPLHSAAKRKNRKHFRP